MFMHILQTHQPRRADADNGVSSTGAVFGTAVSGTVRAAACLLLHAHPHGRHLLVERDKPDAHTNGVELDDSMQMEQAGSAVTTCLA
jgi:hypothetical protein